MDTQIKQKRFPRNQKDVGMVEVNKERIVKVVTTAPCATNKYHALSHITIPTYVAAIGCNLRLPATYVGMVMWGGGTCLWHMG